MSVVLTITCKNAYIPITISRLRKPWTGYLPFLCWTFKMGNSMLTLFLKSRCWVLRHFLTPQVITVAVDIEREKSDKFCSEALTSAWGSFMCRKSTTRDQRLYPSEGTYTQDFYALKNPSTPAGFEPASLACRGEYDNHWTTGLDENLWSKQYQLNQ